MITYLIDFKPVECSGFWKTLDVFSKHDGKDVQQISEKELLQGCFFGGTHFQVKAN